MGGQEPTAMIENLTFEEITVGMHVEVSRQLSPADIRQFAALTGDVNPLHVDREFARDHRFHGLIAHGMWGGALIAGVVGTRLPGAGSILVTEQLEFLHPIRPGETVRAAVEVTKKHADGKRVTLDCRCRMEDGTVALAGTLEVIAPPEKLRREPAGRPGGEPGGGSGRLSALVARAGAENAAPLRCAVVNPVNAVSLRGALAAAEAGLIEPVLVGPEPAVRRAAEEADPRLDLDDCAFEQAEDAAAAARAAAGLAHEGRVGLLMKGALHTDVLMHAALDAGAGLRGTRQASHVFVVDVPRAERLLLLSDGAINIAPDLQELADITRNAIDVARALGIDPPRVAVLSATETVNQHIASTVSAAALCKMAERGQIPGGIVDGPLAFDNAISAQAAAIKGIESAVAGCADVLIVPDFVAGNMLAKQLDYLAGAEAAGLVVGTKVPIVLTSRADTASERLASAAAAVLVQAHGSANAGEAADD